MQHKNKFLADINKALGRGSEGVMGGLGGGVEGVKGL